MTTDGQPPTRKLLIAAPRGFCAGVVRAYDILDEVLRREPPPVYCFHEIVHNRYVVRSFEERGAVFVDDVELVPDGARLIFSAHGVSPAVRERAAAKRLRIIDATCPLVTKVHLEARKAARDGFDVVLIGHEDHEEIEGTRGEAPDRTVVVGSKEDVERLAPENADRVFVVTQTTLSVDDTRDVIDEIRRRAPNAEVRNDICYATENRQQAVRTIASRAQLVLVVGSQNSSNSNRLREVAASAGARAYRIDDASEIRDEWLEGVETIGLTAGASVPDVLLDRVIEYLRRRGVSDVEEVRVADETQVFALPEELAPRG
ncbi:MAG TPA: 4-hydroxy-3-methylbut-2-enyl diphosphate reductase [Dehalococcoidia bacterium]|nr:4-hydroxy-3-methylbut-2-enyl diphosphate reductase [Dehalococcoidia bacterium]